MFSNSSNSYNIGNYHIYERHSYFCSICKQRFLTEKNFNRHIISRKHIRQMQFFAMTSFRFVRRPTPFAAKLDLLSDEQIAVLIKDLMHHIDQKENFFNEIELVKDNEIDVITGSMQSQQPEYRYTETATLYSRPKLIQLNSTPPSSPCLECFQTLDSQQSFNDHMLRVHYNIDGRNSF